MFEIEQVIYRPGYKGEGFQTAIGYYEGQKVIIKSGDTRLDKEAKTLLDVDYPGIPKVIEWIREKDDNRHLILEYLEGEGLDRVIKLDSNWNSEKVTLDEACFVVGGLANCLSALRNRGYLYRDLNLNHVLVGESQVSLIDMEACEQEVLPGVWRVSSKAGTWETMAEEEFSVGNQLSESTNTYMLGVVALQLVTGSNPFFVEPSLVPDPEKRREYAWGLHAQNPKINTEDESMSQFLNQALASDPSQRFETINDFQSNLSQAVLSSTTKSVK